MEFELKKNPPDYDHDSLFITNGKKKGHGYIGRDGNVGLSTCPDCERENYALNVTTGICTWCGFDLKAAYKPK